MNCNATIVMNCSKLFKFRFELLERREISINRRAAEPNRTQTILVEILERSRRIASFALMSNSEGPEDPR